MLLQFFIPLERIPTVTHQQHRVGKRKNGSVYLYDGDRLSDARELFTSRLASFAPTEPITSGVRLITKWIYPITNGHHDGEYKTTRPDLTNVIKLFEDCMTATGFFADDALVCSQVNEKFYGKIPGIFVRVETVEGDCI